jgi:hypothetical protein
MSSSSDLWGLQMALKSLNRHSTVIGTMYGIHSSTYFFAIADKEALDFSFLLWFHSQNVN